MRVTLPYGLSSGSSPGRGQLDLEVADDASILDPMHPPPLADVAGAIRGALSQPIAASSLASGIAPDDSVAIVFSSAVPAPLNAALASEILAALEAAGVRRDRITLILQRDLEHDSAETDPVRMLDRAYRVVVHDPADRDGLIFQERYPGERRAGVYLNEAYQRASARIVTGLAEPHFAAGWRPALTVLPGLAAGYNALRTLSVANLLQPDARSGVTTGNPIFEEAVDLTESVGATLACWLTVDRQGAATGVFAGGFRRSLSAAIDAAPHSSPAENAPFDVVLAAAPGAATLAAATPALLAAIALLRPGGTIMLAAECPAGIGSTAFESMLFDAQGPEALWETLIAADFAREDQWFALALASARRTATVELGSALEAATVRRAHCIPTSDIGLALSAFTASFHLRTGGMPSVAILPDAPRLNLSNVE